MSNPTVGTDDHPFNVATFDSAGNPRRMPYILAQSAVPVAMQSNGTIAVNGIVTLVTALTTTYSGGIWLRFPAGAVVGGLTGLYWAVMSSTTQGQVYTNFHDAATQFIPSVPSGTLVAAVGSGVAYTQTTGADITLTNVTLPGGGMGALGALTSTIMFQHINSAGAKTIKYNVGSTLLLSRTRTTSVGEDWGPITLRNRGVQNRNVSPAGGTGGASQDNANTAAAGHNVSYTIDTSVAQAITLTAQLAVATDYAICDGFTHLVLPS